VQKINPRSPVPLYYQLADILLEKIRRGDYPPGTRIPSEHSLAAAYGIGRPTARQATERLVRKGILVRRRGAGTFVNTEQQEVDLFSFGGTAASFREKGIPFTTEILQTIRLKKIRGKADNPFSGKTAYFLSRLSRAKEVPVLVEDIYLDASLFAGIDAFDLSRRSLSQIVDEAYYLRPLGGKQNFRIGTVSGKMAQALKVSADIPVLMVERFLHFADAENALYSELICRTDQFVFSQTTGGTFDG